MQSVIDQIAHDAREAGRSREVAFCTEIRQVRFNAWHYADANLWASLVIHIFEELGAPSGPGADGERRKTAADERRRLVVKLETQQQLLAEATARRGAAESMRDIALIALKTGGGDIEVSIAEDAEVKRAQERIEQDLGLHDVTPAKIEEVADDLAGLVGQFRKAWRLLSRGREVAPILVPLALAVGLGIAVHFVVNSGTAAWVVSLALGSVGTFIGFVAGPLAGVRSIGGAAMRAARSIESAREARKNELQRRVFDAELAVKAIELEIVEIEEGRRLRRFIEDRSRSADYLSHLGIVSLIRRDFEKLSRLLEDNRRARRDAETPPHDLPSIERVILYIDDLDRCSAAQVVEVLEAVHLLLAFDIFVAVVSVDPRWLVRSLRQHHPGQLRSNADDDHAASPLDYLEKIFQVPFALRPMGRTGYQSLVGKVLPVLPRPQSVLGEEPSPQLTHPVQKMQQQLSQAPSVQSASVRDLDPENLRVHEHELQFAQALWPLIATPRAAKRLINLYRLIRVSLSAAEFKALVRREPAGDHEIVLLLLAALVGFPTAAGNMFHDLLNSSEPEFWTLVESNPDRWSDLSQALLEVRPARTDRYTLDRVRQWIPRVGRHSFLMLRRTE